MSRTQKQGIEYYPLAVDFFVDKKIKILKARYGADGIAILIYLLCQIYREGYYLQVDKDFEYVVSDDLNMSSDKVKQVITFLLERSMFDEQLFKSDAVLTSAGIQERWQNAVKTRAEKTPITVEKYWLLRETETKPYIKYVNFQNSSAKKEDSSQKKAYSSAEESYKEKESKEKESKRERSAALPRLSLSQQRFHDAFPKKKIDAEIPDNLDLDAFIEQIKESVFLSECDNLGLLWCLKRREDILAGKYRKFKNKPDHGFAQRDYTEEELNGLFERFRFANEE